MRRESDTGTTKDEQNVIKQLSTVFKDNLSRHKNMEADLNLKENAEPVFRPVPFSVRRSVEEEPSRLERIAVRKQKGSARFCAYFSIGLNAALENNHHPLLAAENIYNSQW
ncbi:unnamed protein product [Hymenolepis diminuta]|uniref:Uncharacterized protein n=1 Tax=Hymenolepis diminuta TaxID=6216 RepID=A0A0R3SSS5_HYMDI|nr:unnamed protein product [Hymenolepis diminuta]VUZ56776.1 unnamed protein product [Hymenolepis diminuta]